MHVIGSIDTNNIHTAHHPVVFNVMQCAPKIIDAVAMETIDINNQSVAAIMKHIFLYT